jgi:hypothetical protein
MAVEVVDVLVRSVAVPNPPTSGVLVRVYDVTGTTLITAGITDVDGHVSFMLDGGSSSHIRYQLRTFKIGMALPQPVYIDVYSPPASSPTGTNNFRLDAEVFTLPPAVDPALCRLSGFVRDPAGRARRGLDIHFIHRFKPLIVGEGDDSVGVLGERIAIRTDKDGFLQVDLYRKGCYHAIVQSHENVARDVFVPDLGAANINLVLFPRVYGVVFTPSTLTVDVGTTLTVNVQVQLTSGYVINGTASDDIDYSQPDGNPSVDLQVLDDRLLLRGLTTGASTLFVKRKDTSLAYEPDSPIVGDATTILVV